MSGILDRLARNVRAYLHDVVQRHVFTAAGDAPWLDAEDRPDEPLHDGAAEPSGPLPYSAVLADAYRLLDLPFGASLEDVSRRRKAYLKRCHPDRFHDNPERQAEATELTQQLNAAYAHIAAAWKTVSRSHD